MTNSRRSVLFGLLGILVMIGFNFHGYQIFLKRLESSLLINFLDTNTPWSLLGLVFVFFGIFYGIKARRQKERHALLGIGLAIFVFILVLHPVWPYFVSGY